MGNELSPTFVRGNASSRAAPCAVWEAAGAGLPFRHRLPTSSGARLQVLTGRREKVRSKRSRRWARVTSRCGIVFDSPAVLRKRRLRLYGNVEGKVFVLLPFFSVSLLLFFFFFGGRASTTALSADGPESIAKRGVGSGAVVPRVFGKVVFRLDNRETTRKHLIRVLQLFPLSACGVNLGSFLHFANCAVSSFIVQRLDSHVACIALRWPGNRVTEQLIFFRRYIYYLQKVSVSSNYLYLRVVRTFSVCSWWPYLVMSAP